MESTSARIAPEQTGGGRPTRPAQSRWTLLAGAVICAVVLAVAYGIISVVRGDDWSANARTQAQLFVYASPVIDKNIGNVEKLQKVAEAQTGSDPPVYRVDFKVDGQKRDGKVEVDLRRDAPDQWIVSGAELKLPHRSVNLY
jgi:hypothetical protein